MNQEGDLVSTDLDNQSLTQHTLNRYAGASDPSQSLYGYIRTSHGVNLADPESLPRVLRPHDQRDLIEDESSISNLDTDEGVLVQVDFSELVRVKTILLSTPPSGEERPAACKVWVNRADGVTLDQVDDLKPDQEFELLPERGAVEYATRLSRFSNVSSLVLYLVRMQGHYNDILSLSF